MRTKWLVFCIVLCMALLITDDDYLPVLLKTLNHAKKSIDILAFSFAMYQSAGEVAKRLVSLKEKHGAKLTIRLYIEGHRDTADRNRITAEYLKSNGIKVKYGSTHAKGFCVDGQYLLFGSTNLTHQSITKNHETNLLLDDPKAIAGFEKYFEHLWKGGKHGGVKLKLPMIADGAFAQAIIEMIDRAEKRIDFSIYFFQHPGIEQALIGAHRRKVKIRGFIHNHESFAMSYVYRTRSTVKRLKEAGLKDLHYGPTHLFTHSKYIIVDRNEIALGTGNWLMEDVKIHPQLYIQFVDPKIAKELTNVLSQQIKEAK